MRNDIFMYLNLIEMFNMFILFAITFIKFAHLTIQNNESAPNPAVISSLNTEEADFELELEPETPVRFNELNNYLKAFVINTTTSKSFEAGLILNNNLQNEIMRSIEDEEHEETTIQFFSLLNNLITYSINLKKKLRRREYNIQADKKEYSSHILKAIQQLELKNSRYIALPNSSKKIVGKIQELILFLVENIFNENFIAFRIIIGLSCPEEISNKFIRSFLESDRDLGLLEKLETVLEKLFEITDSYEETFIELQSILNNLLLRFNIKVLAPVLLKEIKFANDIIKSDNNTLNDYEEEFVERYQIIDAKQLVLIMPLQFHSKDNNIDKLTIRMPILLKDDKNDLTNEQEKVNNS